MFRSRSLKTPLTALALAAVTVLPACSTGGEAEGGGPGIEYGATMAEYQAAFEDVEPIHLYTQTPGPKGSFVSDKMQTYYDAITEWSGGKITFDIFYANGIAGAAEVDDALGDGRLDIDGFSPAVQPAEYPATNALINASFLGDMSPIAGMLQSHGFLLDASYEAPEIEQEFTDNGLQLLMPSYNGGGMALLCTEPTRTLGQLNGRQVAAAGRTQGAELTGLGATPVSASYSELYESLQRGVVDCTATSVQNAVLGGYLGVTPNVVIDPQVAFALTYGSVALNQNSWNRMPLIAKQLLFDRLDVFIESNIRTSWDAIVQGVNEILDEGGQITPFGDDARERLERVNEQQLDAFRTSDVIASMDTVVDAWVASANEWADIVENELGYDADMTYSQFADFYTEDSVDLKPFVDVVFEKILMPHRPGDGSSL